LSCVDKHEATISVQTQKYTTLASEKETLEDAYRQLETKNSNLERELKKQSDLKVECENELNKLRSELDEVSRKSHQIFVSALSNLTISLCSIMVIGTSKRKEEELREEVAQLKTDVSEKSHLIQKLEKEDKRKQIQLDEQAERILKLTKEVEDSQEEIKKMRTRFTEDKKKLNEEKERFIEKLQIQGNKLMDAERNLNRERESKIKMREEYEDELERLKKEAEKALKYYQEREAKYLSEIDEHNQAKVTFESRKRKEMSDMMEEMSQLREENRNLSRSAMEFKANVEALEERAKLFERR
jgi:chromosome segregation ATPase